MGERLKCVDCGNYFPEFGCMMDDSNTTSRAETCPFFYDALLDDRSAAAVCGCEGPTSES